jgi:hypothetical protein
MKNVKKLRTEKKSGNFFSASSKILLDSNLTLSSLRLLIAILNDSDDFNISETVYCNKLNMKKQTYYDALKNLEQNGYLRKTEIDGKVAPINGKGGKKANSSKVMYFYIVSEFGNLNTTKSEDVIVEDIKHTPTQTIKTPIIKETIKKEPTPVVEKIKETIKKEPTQSQKLFWEYNSEKIKNFYNAVCQQKSIEKSEIVKKEFVNLINEKIEYIYSTSGNNQNVIIKRIQEELLTQKPLYILIERANKKINKKELV